MKKRYKKPAMKVVKLQSHTHLLQSSGYPGEVYAPGTGKEAEERNLA